MLIDGMQSDHLHQELYTAVGRRLECFELSLKLAKKVLWSFAIRPMVISYELPNFITGSQILSETERCIRISRIYSALPNSILNGVLGTFQRFPANE